MMADPELHPDTPPGLYLISAFLAMEPADALISLSRVCGGGLITERVQRFIWDHCIALSTAKEGYPAAYLKKFVKKVIYEVESGSGVVLDDLYEQCGYFMVSVKDDGWGSGKGRVRKCISFLFPDGCSKLLCSPSSGKLLVPLHCSLNMLEGDTGCCVWPSSLYLSEFILSFPDIFYNKSIFEIGSGVGLVGICLSHVGASKVILSDGDLSTLGNMKLNLELNQLAKAGMGGKCQPIPVHLPWESATESELQEFMPDIILGADVIYDPLCLPDLVRLVKILLDPAEACSPIQKPGNCNDVEVNGENERIDLPNNVVHSSDGDANQRGYTINPCQAGGLSSDRTNSGSKKGPVAYVASVIRNVDTFEYFLKLSRQANLVVADMTETLTPASLLPYMQSYNRRSIRLCRVTSHKS